MTTDAFEVKNTLICSAEREEEHSASYGHCSV